MGREVRMVPPGWEHPREPGTHGDGGPRYRPLLKGPYSERLAEWDEGNRRREAGEVADWSKWPEEAWKPRPADMVSETYEEYAGSRPVIEDYMPEWPEGVATMLVMYENTSEGTPISPAFATPEELARWLADNEASAFADLTATYEQWLATIRRGSAMSAVLTTREGGPNTMQSGVAAMGS